MTNTEFATVTPFGTPFTREQAKAADHILYDLMMVASIKERDVVWAIDAVRHNVDRQTGWGRNTRWGMTLKDAEAKNVELAATDTTYMGRQAQDRLDKLAEARAALAEANAAVQAQDALWTLHGQWNRYAVVPRGHIHTEFGCFTLRSDTDVRWAFEVSGDSVEEAIEVYGEALCSHCFPDAPVDKTTGKVEVDEQGNPITKAAAEAARAARQAEKDAKLAAKNAKKVFEPGTTRQVVSIEGEAVSTEVALNRQILEAMTYSPSSKHYSAERIEARTGNPLPTYGEWIAYAINALAAKRGVTTEALRAEYNAKLAKKNSRY